MLKRLLPLLLIVLFAIPAFAVPDSFAPVVKQAMPSVVNISTSKTVTRRTDPFFENFFGFNFGFGGPNQKERKFKSSALGSGFLIDKEGFIVTNNHVIDGADEIIVKFPNNKEYKAKIVGADPLTDLALLKIEAKRDNLQPIALGDSDKAEIGDWVVAIGNPLGLGGTVTAGILSAKGRVIGEGPYDDFMQTDVAINPGNSGGPLINMRGEVIGINTAIIQSAQGLGFAVPVNILKNIVTRLKQGKVARGWLGVTLQALDEKLAKSFGLDENTQGVLIADVSKGEPGDKGGLKAGDVIVSVDGVAVADSKTLVNIIGSKMPNEKVTLEVIRDNKKRNISVVLGERPVNGVVASNGNDSGNKNDEDISVKTLSNEERKSVGLDSGVIVTNVKEGSSAFNAGIRQGDVIVSLNRKAVQSADDFYDKYLKVKKGSLVVVKIASQYGSRFIAFNK